MLGLRRAARIAWQLCACSPVARARQLEAPAHNLCRLRRQFAALLAGHLTDHNLDVLRKKSSEVRARHLLRRMAACMHACGCFAQFVHAHVHMPMDACCLRAQEAAVVHKLFRVALLGLSVPQQPDAELLLAPHLSRLMERCLERIVKEEEIFGFVRVCWRA